MFPPTRPTLCLLVGFTLAISRILFVKRLARIIRIDKMALNIMSVLILDDVSPICGEILTRHGIVAIYKNGITNMELLREIPKYEALVVRKTLITRDIIAAATKLKLVAQAGVSVGNIDYFAAATKNIQIINVPEARIVSISEMTCSLIMNLSRCIVPADAALKAGIWGHRFFHGTEINGKTLAVLGLGKVGREVAKRMHAFDMKIIGFDNCVTERQCAQFHVRKMELHEIWPLADYITLHETFINATEYSINETVLRNCKQGVKIINVTNVRLFNSLALLNAIWSGKVSGVALDAFEKELPADPITARLIKHPNVIATPNLSAFTKEAEMKVSKEIAEKIVNYVNPSIFNNCKAEVMRYRREN